uniref:Putative ovule protein n=1 Tax=Solanum chacoense TaxID=4108 RepID=A0A0V0GWZ6_SOLCH
MQTKFAVYILCLTSTSSKILWGCLVLEIRDNNLRIKCGIINFWVVSDISSSRISYTTILVLIYATFNVG